MRADRSMAGAKQFAMYRELALTPAAHPRPARARGRCRRRTGIPGIGAKNAAQLLNRHGAIESFPPRLLGDRCGAALQEACDRGGRMRGSLIDVKTLHCARDAAFESCMGRADGGAAANRTMRKGGRPAKPGLAPARAHGVAAFASHFGSRNLFSVKAACLRSNSSFYPHPFIQ